MVTPSYSLCCTGKRLIAPNVYELRFIKPEHFTFKAGQFVLFDVPLIETPADIQPRAYSIASAPADPELLFAIQLKPGGRASAWVEHVVSEGSVISAKGPFGFFTIDPESKHQLVLLATGAGVVPFRSHIRWLLLEEKSSMPIRLVFGGRHEENLFWMNEFRELARVHPHFHFHPSLTQPSAEWKGEEGRVQAVCERLIADFSNVNLYVCGSPAMVADVKKTALDVWHMEKKNVHTEGYV